MTPRSSARTVGHVRRRDRVRRRSARLTAVRAGAMLVMAAAAAALYGVVTSPVFGLERVRVEGAALTDEGAVRTRLGLAGGTNLVTLETAGLVSAIESLPTVRHADVTAGLPGTVRVTIVERLPILVWAAGERRFLVDVDGRVFDELGAAEPVPAVDPDGRLLPVAAAAGGTPLPILSDTRASAVALRVGDILGPVELDAARRLGSLRPADVGSAATALRVVLDDKSGFILRPVKGAWRAVFGFYTPTLRPPALVPEQVRLLRSLLVDREAEVGRVILASATDGTYVPRPSPSPSPSPAP